MAGKWVDLTGGGAEPPESTAELLGTFGDPPADAPRAGRPLDPVALGPGGPRAPSLDDTFRDPTEATEVVEAPLPPPPEPEAPPPVTPDRYEDRGLIARGGMGEVRRAYDRVLQRGVAVKTLQPSRTDALSARRFHREAVVTAQLQHPAIVPIYDLGQRPDGTRFFTMREVSGDTLQRLVAEVHAASGPDWGASPRGWTLHRLVLTVSRVAEAVAYAHARGAVHRDLKPENIMVGDFGEVQVLDWGLVKVVGEGVREPDVSGDLTRWGTVTGTPAYMAPEQATGEVNQIGTPADVYGLGAMLYHVLTGGPPFVGSLPKVLISLIDGELEPPSRRSKLPVPPELEAACVDAMRKSAAERPTATGFLRHLQAWLDGSPKRDQALGYVAEARRLWPRARALTQRARALELRAEQMLAKLPSWASEEKKLPAWEIADDAVHQAREARQVELSARRLLQRALAHDPDCVEAHRLLATAWRHDHDRAERARDTEAAERAEEQLRSHLDLLPPADADDHRRYLAGDGRLVLRTEPAGADARLYRYEVRNRRWVAILDRDLGPTPLELTLPMGRYQVVLKKRGHHTVHYPVLIDRCATWDGAPPGASEPYPVVLPPRGALEADDVYVPAGWYRAGDSSCDTASPPARVWVDAFVIGRFPVTVAAYVAFLDDLVAQGRADEAFRHQPRRGVGGLPLLVRGPDGRFVHRPDDDLLAEPTRPIVGVDYPSAVAWLIWEGQRRGQPLRLPGELEWEKAARGVDGRAYPWGERVDPTWTRIRASARTRPEPAVVDSYPVDVSPYGVRGMAGNVSDWCGDAWRSTRPDTVADRAVPPALQPEDPSPRTQRGGNWLSPPSAAHVAGRQRAELDATSVVVGFRWCRTLS